MQQLTKNGQIVEVSVTTPVLVDEELRRVQTALEALRERYLNLYDLAPVGYFTLSEEGVIMEANLTAAKLLGVERGTLVRRPLKHFILFADDKTYQDFYKQLFEPGISSKAFELRMVKQDGSQFWARLETTVSDGSDGCIAVMSDITQQMMAKEVPREIDPFSFIICDSLIQNIAVLDAQGVIIAVNGAWQRFAEQNGAPELAVNSRGLNYLTACEKASGFPNGEEAVAVRNGIQAVLSGALLEFKMEYPCHSPEAKRGFKMYVSPLRGSRKGAVITHLDITERRRMEAVLEQHHVDDEDKETLRTQKERKRLQREVLRISEREKQLIAQELHDGLCQHFSGTAMMGALLHRRLAEADHPEAANAKQIGDLLKTGVDEARNLSHGLHPVRPGADGLVEALKQYAQTATNLFHIRCSFHCGKGVEIECEVVSTHLFRIAQEAMNNAMKHGQSTRVLITLKRGPEGITLAIRDNGIGIPLDAPPSKGMGRQIMDYRAAAIGGTVNVRRAGKRGTVVSCTLPC